MRIYNWARRLHFYTTVFFNGFAMCMLMIQLPDVAIAAYSLLPGACTMPDSVACMTARSQASIALGVSNGAKAVMALLLGPALGALSDVYGRRFFWLGSQILCMLGYILFLIHLLGLCSLMPFLIINAFAGFLLPATLAVVADDYAPEQRAKAFGLVIATFDASILLGPVLFAGASLTTGAILAVVAAAIGLGLSALYGDSLPPSERLDPGSGQWRPDVALSVLNSSPLFRRLSFVIVASTLPMAGMQQCFLLFLETAYGLSRATAGGYVAVLAVGGLVVQVICLPMLVRRKGVVFVLMVGLFMQLLQCILLALAHSELAVVLSCVFGGFSSLVFPSVSALKANAAPPSEQGRVQGAVSALQNFALGLGPLVYGGFFSLLIGPHSPLGRPCPQAVFLLSILVIIPAGFVSMTLKRHLPESADVRQVPSVRRGVSVNHLSARKPSTGHGDASLQHALRDLGDEIGA